MPRWVLLGFCKEEASKQPVCFEMFCFGLNNCLSCVSAQKIVFLIKTHAAYMISCRGSCKSLRHSVVFSLGTFSFPPLQCVQTFSPPRWSTMPALHQDPLSPYYCVHVPLEKRVKQNGDSVLGHCRKKSHSVCLRVWLFSCSSPSFQPFNAI